MNFKQVFEKLCNLLDVVEKEYDVENQQEVFINGYSYKPSDFRNFKRVIENANRFHVSNVSSSQKYEYKYYDYHKVLRKLNYYTHKKNKKQSDYEKIEELQKELLIEKQKREENRIKESEKAIRRITTKDYKKDALRDYEEK